MCIRDSSRADFAERVCIAIPASRPHEEIITLDELADARFISLAGSRRFRSICDELCATRGFEPDVMFESDNPAVVRKMISLGLGVGFWPERSWGPVNGDDVIVLPLADDGFSRTIRLELTSRGLEKEAARAFFEHLVAHFAGVWEKMCIRDRVSFERTCRRRVHAFPRNRGGRTLRLQKRLQNLVVHGTLGNDGLETEPLGDEHEVLDVIAVDERQVQAEGHLLLKEVMFVRHAEHESVVAVVGIVAKSRHNLSASDEHLGEVGRDATHRDDPVSYTHLGNETVAQGRCLIWK